jgi:predicted SAM-dependent methyltransferase
MQANESTSQATIGHSPPVEVRENLVRRYIRGSGIEIGALHQPLPIPKNLALVKYVDRFDVDNLRIHYPELMAYPLVDVNIVDDGEKLTTFRPESVDFIVANHFLEHTQDPIGTLKRHIGVLKPGGILYMAVPDKRYTFDHLRPNTTLEHLLRDHEQGPKASYFEHVQEYVKLVDGLTGSEYDRKVTEICNTDYSIHFHVWDADSLRRFMTDLVINHFRCQLSWKNLSKIPQGTSASVFCAKLIRRV